MYLFCGLYSRERPGAQKACRSLKQELIHTSEWKARCRDRGVLSVGRTDVYRESGTKTRVQYRYIDVGPGVRGVSEVSEDSVVPVSIQYFAVC